MKKLKSKETFHTLEKCITDYIFEHKLFGKFSDDELIHIGKHCYDELKKEYKIQKLTRHDIKLIAIDAKQQAECRYLRTMWKI